METEPTSNELECLEVSEGRVILSQETYGLKEFLSYTNENEHYVSSVTKKFNSLTISAKLIDLKDKTFALKEFIAKVSKDDPYVTSVTYYAMTGRKGLWIYFDGDAGYFLISCIHPNKENTLLLFPPKTKYISQK